MTEKIVFYLLPVVAGILIDVLVSLLMVVVEDDVAVVLYKTHPVLYLIIPMIALVLLGAIVFSFRIYQNMAALQEERAEKIILENQITQMQGSMVELEHLYDGVRSVKHDLMQSWLEMLVHPPMDFMRQEIVRIGESGRKNIKSSRRMC